MEEEENNNTEEREEEDAEEVEKDDTEEVKEDREEDMKTPLKEALVAVRAVQVKKNLFFFLKKKSKLFCFLGFKISVPSDPTA